MYSHTLSRSAYEWLPCTVRACSNSGVYKKATVGVLLISRVDELRALRYSVADSFQSLENNKVSNYGCVIGAR